MDFHSMKRKELQSLCKKYNIPANLSNLNMANKLTQLIKENGKEKEKPLTRGHPSLKRRDDNVSETECDSFENKKPKKVRFSPEHELIEFTRSRDVKGRCRRKSVLRDNSDKVVVESLNNRGEFMQCRELKLTDGVNEKKRGRKLSKIDDVKDIVDSIDAGNENECENKVASPGRVLRSRRQTLVDLLVNDVESEEIRVVVSKSLRNTELDRCVKANVKEKEDFSENGVKSVILEPEIGLRRSKRNASKIEDEGARKFKNGGRRCSRNKQTADSATETKVEVVGRHENVKACDKKVDNQDRFLRSRRHTLIDLPGDENKRRQGVENSLVLANVECDESRFVTMRSLRNKETVNEAVKENLKEKEEVLENKEIVEENMNLEPKIVTRRPRRNADKFEDEGARKYMVEGRREVQIRRNNRCKNTTSHEEMGNDEPVAENKDSYQLSTIIETGTTTDIHKEDITVAQETRVTRRPRRRTVVSQSVVETHRLLDDETLENDRLKEPLGGPCLVEDGPIREVNTRRSRRIASKKEPATTMDELDGKVNVPRKNGGRKQKGICISGDNAIKPDDDCNERPLSNGNDKATHIPVNSKVGQKRKQPSREEKASHEDMSAIAESFPIDAQLLMSQVEEITTDAAMSCYDIATNVTNDAGQTAGGEVYGEKQNPLVEVNAGSFDSKEVNGPELENRENNLTSKNVDSQIENPEPEQEISVSKSMEVVNKFHVPVEVEADNSFEDISNTSKDESAAVVLVCQTEDFGCINMLDDGEQMSNLNITGNSGSARVIPSTNVSSLVNESESMTKLEVIEAELDKSANKTIFQSSNPLDHVIECEVDNMQDNQDMVGLEAVNEITSSSNGCASDVDPLAASDQRFEEGNRDTVVKAAEDGVLHPCGETGNKISTQENNYAEDPVFSTELNADTSFETNIFSDIHCSDHIASPAMFGYLTEININASSSSSMEASVSILNGTRDSLGLELQNEMRKESPHSMKELYRENSVSTTQKDALVGCSFDSDRNHGSIVAELENHLELETQCMEPKKIDASVIVDIGGETWSKQRNAYRFEILQPISSPQVGEFEGIFATHDEAANSKPEKEALSIGTKTSGFETSLDTNISKDDKGTHSDVNESSENDENEPGLLVNLFATPVGLTNSIQKKEAWSTGCKAACGTSLTETTSKGADVSSNKERNDDVARSIYSACNKVEFESNIGLVTESMDPEKVDASVTSVSEDNREEIDAGSGEGWLKRSNANRTGTLLSVVVALPALAATQEEFETPLATHVGDTKSIQEDEVMSIGSQGRGEVTPVHSAKRKEDYVILSQVNKSPRDEVDEPGLLESLFATPVGAANAAQNKENQSIGSQAAAGNTLSLGMAASRGEHDTFSQADEIFCKDRKETLDVAISVDVACNKMEFESHSGLVIVGMDSQKIELNRSFTAHVCRANIIQENEALSSRNNAAESTSVHITTSKGDCGVPDQVNHIHEELRDDLSVTPVGVVNILEKENRNPERKVVVRTMSLDKAASKGGHEIPSQADESFGRDRNDQKFSNLFGTSIDSTSCDTPNVDARSSVLEKEALSIGSKTAGFATSIHTIIGKGDEGTRIQANESSEDGEAKAGLLVNLFATPVAIRNTIQNEPWSIRGNTAGETIYLNNTTSIRVNGSSNKDKNANCENHEHSPAEIVDVPISMDTACNNMEFDSNFELVIESMDSDEINASVIKDTRGKDIDAADEESWSKQSNTSQTETHEKDPWSIGINEASEKMSSDKIASKVECDNFTPADLGFSTDGNEIMDETMPMDIATNKMEFESHFELTTVSNDKIGVSVSKDTGEEIHVGGSIDESWLKQSIANRTETLLPVIVALPASAATGEELKSPFTTYNIDANAIQESEPLMIGSRTAGKPKSIQSTIDNGDYAILSQVNQRPEDDANEQDQLKILFPTPVESATHSKMNETVERNSSTAVSSEKVVGTAKEYKTKCKLLCETQSTPEESKETQNTFQNADYGAESCLFSYLENSDADVSNFNLTRDHLKDGEELEENSTSMLTKQQVALLDHQLEDKDELSSAGLALSVLPVSGYDETLKESKAKSNLNPVKFDEIDEHRIENEDAKMEEMLQLVETARESKDTVASLAYADVAIDGGYVAKDSLISPKRELGRWDSQEDAHSFGSKNFCPTAKNAARTILIHGTPNKAPMRSNMKENAPDSKRDNTVNLTTLRPAKRRALQDLQLK